MGQKNGFTPLEMRMHSVNLTKRSENNKLFFFKEEGASQKRQRRFLSLTGFTYIELLIALIIIGVCLLPIMRMFTASLEQVYAADEIMTALMVGRINMESLKNLTFTKKQIEELGTIYNPPLKEPPLKLNNMEWRALREPVIGTDPLEIHIKVFKSDKLNKPVLEFITLFEDLEWTSTE